MFDLTGKNAIITGSSKGIGKSIAAAMAQQGANVVISSRKADVCEATAEEINSMGFPGKAIVIPCNISDKTALEMLVEETRSQLGQIDILVCNAASNPFFGSIKDIPDDAFEKIMNNNIKSNHNFSFSFITRLKIMTKYRIHIVSSCMHSNKYFIAFTDHV